ncbi:MAG: hypothetical protein H0U95_00905 [Bacteroidetes bacterium]|nr:hypothetical protein [Bacteroidota bacterium]
MEKEIIIDSTKIKFDVLQVIDKNNSATEEQVIAINATDIIHLPDVVEKALAYISKTFPNMKTIYYRVSVNITPIMVDNTNHSASAINISPEDLKKYELTLESLKSKY